MILMTNYNTYMNSIVTSNKGWVVSCSLWHSKTRVFRIAIAMLKNSFYYHIKWRFVCPFLDFTFHLIYFEVNFLHFIYSLLFDTSYLFTVGIFVHCSLRLTNLRTTKLLLWIFMYEFLDCGSYLYFKSSNPRCFIFAIFSNFFQIILWFYWCFTCALYYETFVNFQEICKNLENAPMDMIQRNNSSLLLRQFSRTLTFLTWILQKWFSVVKLFKSK